MCAVEGSGVLFLDWSRSPALCTRLASQLQGFVLSFHRFSTSLTTASSTGAQAGLVQCMFADVRAGSLLSEVFPNQPGIAQPLQISVSA